MKAITINGRTIKQGHPAYMIAEMSANHHHNYDKAVEIIHAMKKAGADAVKLQTYTPDTMTIRHSREEFRIGGGTTWEGKTLYELYGEAYTPWEWHPKLKAVANNLGMDLFSTPFDPTAADFLEDMGVPAYKIASFELIDIPLIKHVAAKGKPVIMSTGMGTKEEIREAVSAVREAGNDQLILLKCTSAYPAIAEDANLNTLSDMRSSFEVGVGISDHSLGIDVTMGAIRLGACVVEKHFCLSRKETGPDSAFSLEPSEYRAMVDMVRKSEADPASISVNPVVFGHAKYALSENERASMVFRRSLFAVQDIQAGKQFTHENTRVIRPGYGLAPKHMYDVMGKTAKKAIERGTPLSWNLIE